MDPLLYGISFLVLIIIGLGLRYRKERKKHIPLMLSAFVIDVSLVLIIEINRHAVERAVGLTLPAFTWCHIAISTSVVVLYLILITTGIKLAKGNESVRPFHKKLALVFIVLRLANFITSLLLPFKPF